MMMTKEKRIAAASTSLLAGILLLVGALVAFSGCAHAPPPRRPEPCLSSKPPKLVRLALVVPPLAEGVVDPEGKEVPVTVLVPTTESWRGFQAAVDALRSWAGDAASSCEGR